MPRRYGPDILDENRQAEMEERRLNPPTVSDRVADGRAADAQVSAYERYVDALAEQRWPR